MGRGNKRLGKLLLGSPEDLRFRGFFGVSAQVSVTAWNMMEEHSVLPKNSEFLHFLWALAFMRTYPANDTTLSCLLGGSDPKTISKYVWPFIQSLFALNESVVSQFLCMIFINELSLISFHHHAFRFNFKTGRRETLEMTACFRWTGLTFGLRWATQSLFGVLSSRRVVYVTRWGCAS